MKNPLLLLATAFAVVTLSSCDILDPADPGLLVPLTVDQDPSLPSITVNGTQLHSETFGNPDDPMIVVLHGGPGGDYRSLLNCSRFAADGFYVVFYDQRGSGLSMRHDRKIYTTQLFIDDLDAVINYYRRRPGQEVFLLGHSWGAMLATAYVNEHPAAVRGMILVEPGGFTWHDAEEYVKRSRSLDVFGETSNDYVYLDQIITGDDHIKLDYKAALQNAAEYSEGNKVGIPGPYPFWRNGAVCSSAAHEYVKDHPFDFTPNLRQFTTEVLFVYSELNVAYGEAHARMVSSAYPAARLVEARGTGHDVIYFGWAGFYPSASAYLNTLK